MSCRKPPLEELAMQLSQVRLRRWKPNVAIGLAIGLAIALSAAPACRAAAATSTAISAQLHGIYAVNALQTHSVGGQPQRYIVPAVLANNYVDGVLLQIGWEAVETADGVYSWTNLDDLIAEAAAAGKKATLDVIPGWQTPAWVFSEGVQSYSFVWDQTIFGPPLCSIVQIPVPLDPIYLAKWTAFVQAFGARYNSNPTVTGVKMSGINSRDEEVTLPFTINQALSNGPTSCVGFNNVTNWQAAGYTRLLVESAWNQIAAAFQSAFPSKALILVLEYGGFPPLDDNGIVFTGFFGQDLQASADIIADGIAAYSSQLALQNDGLTSRTLFSDETTSAHQITTGYQTISALDAALAPAMNLGVAANAKYLEIYESDLVNPTAETSIGITRLVLKLRDK